MKLKIPQIYSQRDLRWKDILLGYNTDPKYNIGNYGCLITCLAMYIGEVPDEVNDILKQGNGFQAGGGLFTWSKSTLLGLNQLYLSPYYDGPVTLQGIQKVKDTLDGGFPLLCEVDFNPSTVSEEMHFLLLIGYDGDKIFAADPWTGTIVDLDVYGGPQRAIIQFRAYDKILSVDGAIDLQGELDKVRLERDANWNAFVSLCDALQAPHNAEVALLEVQKLIGVEDTLLDRQKKLDDATVKIGDLETQLKTLTDENKQLVDANEILKNEVNEQTDTIKKQAFDLDTLKEQIDALKSAIGLPVFRGWKKAIVALIARL